MNIKELRKKLPVGPFSVGEMNKCVLSKHGTTLVSILPCGSTFRFRAYNVAPFVAHCLNHTEPLVKSLRMAIMRLEDLGDKGTVVDLLKEDLKKAEEVSV